MSDQQPVFLYVEDLQQLFKVGRSKARLMMDALPSTIRIRIGQKDCISSHALTEYLSTHDGIAVKWPKRHR
jgi:hypothetical protein